MPEGSDDTLGLGAEAESDDDDLDLGAAGPAFIEIVEDAAARDLVQQFHSLGSNCEFGLVQRHFGTDPLGLLRWAATPPAMLLRMLDARFAGLGEIENTRILVTPTLEQSVKDTKYGLVMHTFIRETPERADGFLVSQCRRLRWLRDRLVESLEAGDIIFVYKDKIPQFERILGLIHGRLRAYGPNTLLGVRLADAENPAGTVRQIEASLFIGYLSRFGNERNAAGAIRWNIDYANWTSICGRVAQKTRPGALPLDPAGV